MPMVDALAVWAEERRVFKRENNDESLNRRYQSLVSEWGNPYWWKSVDLREETRGWKLEKFFFLLLPFSLLFKKGTRGTETSQYPKENKTIVIALVAASERATV